MRRATLLLPIALTTIACGRSAGHHAEQSVAPAGAPVSVQDDPVAACMESVLVASQLVGRFIPPQPNKDYPRARSFELRNPPTERTAGLGIAIKPTTGAPRYIHAQFGWPGPWQAVGGMQNQRPSDPGTADMVGQALTDVATQLIRQLRDECAPTIPGQPACARISQGQVERCTLGT